MSFRIPLFDLNFGIEEEEAVIEVLKSRWISAGPKTAEFEALFAHALGVRHAVALTNCTAALHLALHVAGVGEDDEVICPSLTFVATANAIRYVRGTPVFCDVKSTKDLNMDAAVIESLVTRRTKAILVMHYGGFPCDMRAITEIAERNGLRIIEDACHAPLSEYEGKKLGTLGDIGCFSFFSNKNISTGEGGMLVTNSDEFAHRVRLLRSHAMTTASYDRARGHATEYDVVDLGYNYRIDDLRSAIGIVQLRKLPQDLERRARVRRRYIDALGKVNGLTIPFRDCVGLASNYICPVVLTAGDFRQRDNVRAALHQRGVQTSVHYPPVHRFQTFRASVDLPVTEYVADRLISLPMHGGMSDDDPVEIASHLSDLLS
jgi:dTDP-4-amino-4,6-dideoxygalactose transaminase